MPDYRIIERPRTDELGEGPLWIAARGRLHWVDIMGRRLNGLDLASGAVDSVEMPERIGWVAERRGRTDLLAGFKSGVVSLTLDPLQIERIAQPEADRPDNRMNDGKVDAAGRLWFGTKDDTDQRASGALYRMDPDGRITRQDDGYKVTNGPAFSPDGRWLYHNDSGLGLVYRFALEADGAIGDRHVFIRFEGADGAPDGMTTDADGCLWIAHWGGGRVSRFDPDGRLIGAHRLPATNVTSCTFAGEGLDRLFVTSARLGSPGRAEDGALFEIDPGVRGLPTGTFAG